MIKCKLGELLDVRRGASLSGKYYATEGKLVRLTLGNFNYPNGGFKENTTKEDIFFIGNVRPEFILKEGDIITPLTEQVAGLLGETARIPESNKYIQSGDIGLIIPDETKLNKLFAYFLVSSPIVKKQLGAAAQQTKIRHTSPDKIKDCEVWIPDLKYQEEAGRILDNINNKIFNNSKIILELEAMSKTIYDYWFLQYEFPNEEGKPYKSSGGKMVYNEKLKREIPEGWDVKSIKECIEHINTGLNPRDNFVLGNGNIKYITVKNLTKEGIFNYDGCDVIDEKAKEIVHNRSDVNVGDILFASIAPLGRCFMVQEYPKEWDINESVFCIRPNQQIISTDYLYLYLTSDMFVKQAENSSTGSIFSGIRINTLESMNLLVPNEKIKEKFTHNIEKIFLKKYKIAKENEELTKLRDELLPLLMNGQVSFKN